MAEANSTVEFRVLGPVEAHAGRRRLDLGGPKQRSLMALLLIEPGRPVIGRSARGPALGG